MFKIDLRVQLKFNIAIWKAVFSVYDAFVFISDKTSNERSLFAAIED